MLQSPIMVHLDSIEPIAAASVRDNDAFMQSATWALAKQARGIHPIAFRITLSGRQVDLLAFDQQPGETAGIIYIPHGPDLHEPPENYAAFMSALTDAMAAHLRGPHACVRFDLPWPSLYWEDQPYAGKPAAHLQEIRMNFGRSAHDQRIVRKAPTDVLPVDTLVLDLSRNLDTILGDMKAKTRYNIRLANRHGIRVTAYGANTPSLPTALAVWEELVQQTEARNELTATDANHVSTLFEADRNTGEETHVELLMAEDSKDDTSRTPAHTSARAAAVIARTRTRALYLYGASSDYDRHKMAPYAVQWSAIQRAGSAGCRWYDFFGVPPTPDEGHPLFGLSRFKRGFGGTELHRAGCWDVPLDEDAYGILRAREAAAPGFHTA